jgi:hypothetical protein
MKYKVLKSHGGKIDGGSGIRREGEVYDIDDGEAAVLLRSGHIEPVKQKVRKTEVKENGENHTE